MKWFFVFKNRGNLIFSIFTFCWTITSITKINKIMNTNLFFNRHVWKSSMYSFSHNNNTELWFHSGLVKAGEGLTGSSCFEMRCGKVSGIEISKVVRRLDFLRPKMGCCFLQIMIFVRTLKIAKNIFAPSYFPKHLAPQKSHLFILQINGGGT